MFSSLTFTFHLFLVIYSFIQGTCVEYLLCSMYFGYISEQNEISCFHGTHFLKGHDRKTLSNILCKYIEYFVVR